MSEILQLDYYYGIEAEQFSFYRVPRLLIKDERFKKLSSDAKLLYGLMLDRMSLSIKNEWFDEDNRAYIIYTIDSITKLFTMDEYGTEYHHFEVHGYDIEVKNTLIAEALKELTERKRNVILLSYFMEMSDADIAREMNLVRSTIHEHRTRSLEILKKIMEGIADEKDV